MTGRTGSAWVGWAVTLSTSGIFQAFSCIPTPPAGDHLTGVWALLRASGNGKGTNGWDRGGCTAPRWRPCRGSIPGLRSLPAASGHSSSCDWRRRGIRPGRPWRSWRSLPSARPAGLDSSSRFTGRPIHLRRTPTSRLPRRSSLAAWPGCFFRHARPLHIPPCWRLLRWTGVDGKEPRGDVLGLERSFFIVPLLSAVRFLMCCVGHSAPSRFSLPMLPCSLSAAAGGPRFGIANARDRHRMPRIRDSFPALVPVNGAACLHVLEAYPCG